MPAMALARDGFALAEADERPYQTTIARQCYGRNSLVVLPTGLGKTIVAALVAARHLENDQRILVVAPTRPLVDQHADTFRTQLPEVDVRAVTGDDAPEDRPGIWTEADVAVATPHVVRNDLYADRVDPDTWGLLVVDEAHRAVGNYAAVPVAQRLRSAGSRVLATTASPGSDAERIQEVCRTLGIEHVEARGEWDDDVKPYVEPVSIEWVRVGLPNSLEDAAAKLREVAESHVDELRSKGLYSSRFLKRGELLDLRDQLRGRLEGDRQEEISRALDHVGHALKLLHGIKLVETQSTAAARAYLTELADDERLARREAFRDARRLLDGYMGEHPKMRRCATELASSVADGDGRALVFVQTRATAKSLAEALDERSRLDVDLFVGQSGEDGLTQDEQLDRIDRFREGETNVLVSTSVGEEGLDIPSVDVVVFYEAVASAIRSIQRRGRTGRDGRGRVVVLMAKGTSDEAAYWAANRREQRMRDLVRELQQTGADEPEPTIRPNPSADADDEAPGLIVDHREFNGALARLLTQKGLTLEPSTVPVGDVVVSSRVVVERKTDRDFVESVIDGRLMDQARSLKKNYEAPMILVEGDPFATRMDVDDAAISGAIAALTSSFQVPVVTVDDARQAADVVAATARREHEEGAGPPKLRHGTGGRELPQQQQFLLEGLPNVSSTLARRLLEHFGSPGEALSATEEQLKEVDGIGPTTATAIHEVLHERTETPWQTETSPSTKPRASTTPSGTGRGKSAS